MSGLLEVQKEQVENFLFMEADLLDAWQLEQWRKLFLEECRYLVPATNADPYAPADTTLHLISDDGFHLTERVKRLGKRTAHAEFPHSRTLRMISNVRIHSREETQLKVASRFVTYRSRNGQTDSYFGRHEYILVMSAGELRIAEKRSILALEALRPQGSLSIIV